MKRFLKLLLVAVIALGSLIQMDNGQYGRVEASSQTLWEFNYTGSSQNWITPKSGHYLIEVWGGQGGNSEDGNVGEQGYYNSSIINLTAGITHNIYVGSKGNLQNKSNYGYFSTAGMNPNDGGRNSQLVFGYSGNPYTAYGNYSGGGGGDSSALGVRAKGGNGASSANKSVNAFDGMYNPRTYVLLGYQGGTGAGTGGTLQNRSGNGFVRITLQNLIPSIILAQPADKLVLSEVNGFNTIPISGNFKDEDIGDILSVKYSIGSLPGNQNVTLTPNITANGNNQAFSGNIAIDSTIPQGSHIFKLWVEDSNGAKSSEITRTIIFDKTAPSITYTGIVAEEQYPIEATLSYSASDENLEQVRATYSLNAGPEYPYISGTTLTEYGYYKINIIAEDKAGNESVQTIFFTIIPPDPIIEVMNVSENIIAIRDLQVYSEDVVRKYIINEQESLWITDCEYTFSTLHPNREHTITIQVRKS